MVSQALLCHHPGPPLPHARPLPLEDSLMGAPTSTCSKCGKNKHFLQHEKGAWNSTPISLGDGQLLPQTQPAFELLWASLQLSSHLILSLTLIFSLPLLFCNGPSLKCVSMVFLVWQPGSPRAFCHLQRKMCTEPIRITMGCLEATSGEGSALLCRAREVAVGLFPTYAHRCPTMQHG